MSLVSLLTLFAQIVLFVVIISIIFRSSPITLGKRVADQTLRTVTGAPVDKLSQITPQLYVGGQHNSRGWVKMQRMGINAIVNMRETQYDDRLYHIVPENYLHLPTIDGTPPSLEDLCAGVKFINDAITTGNKVYIHCASGFHRAPTMTIAYLMFTGSTLNDALTTVKKVRPFARPIKSQMKQLEIFSTEMLNCL